MTTVMASVIAIVLFGMILIGTVSYGDSLGMGTAGDGQPLANRLQHAAATVAQVQHDTGSRPTSVAELEAAGLPDPIQGDDATMTMSCADEKCSPMSLCLVMPASPADVPAAKSAAARVKGYSSGVCGDPSATVGAQIAVTLTV